MEAACRPYLVVLLLRQAVKVLHNDALEPILLCMHAWEVHASSIGVPPAAPPRPLHSPPPSLLREEELQPRWKDPPLSIAPARIVR
jgi:hypothetical protein